MQSTPSDGSHGSRDLFEQMYARDRRQKLLVRICGGALVLVAVGYVGWSAITAPARAPHFAPIALTAAVLPTEPDAPPTDAPPVAPAPQAEASASSSSAKAARGAKPDWSIHVTAAGFQKELDACQWVRMDLGAPAPIVGAHNYCGGSIVLQMRTGDTVTLAGKGVSGNYVMTGARVAHAGDVVETVTAGMSADVILQTCWQNSGGRERLVELTRVATP
jgi:hypothetical protein